MFNMEKYYTDFIARQTRFVSPLETFRPSTEKSPETAFHRPIRHGGLRGRDRIDHRRRWHPAFQPIDAS
jgi:hypothetical protein